MRMPTAVKRNVKVQSKEIDVGRDILSVYGIAPGPSCVLVV